MPNNTKKSTKPAKQLLLPLVPDTLKSFDLFFPGKNHLLIETLNAPTHPQFIYIFGSKGTGKSHLLEAYANQALKQNQRILFLPLKNLTNEQAYLKDWPKFDAVLIDDVEYLSPTLQKDLCYRFNELQAEGTPLIITSSMPPALLDFDLADLKSRMESGLSLNLETLKDEELKQALELHAKHLGLKLNDKIYEFLLNRLERNLTTLIPQLKSVSEYSLLTRKPVTQAMIKEVLSL